MNNLVTDICHVCVLITRGTLACVLYCTYALNMIHVEINDAIHHEPGYTVPVQCNYPIPHAIGVTQVLFKYDDLHRVRIVYTAVRNRRDMSTY